MDLHGLDIRRFDRRRFLGMAAASTVASWYLTPGAFADDLTRTPRQTEGPFYPDKLPLDTDNDLLILNDNLTPAVGEITHLTGKIVDSSGKPLRNAVIEIWQCDQHGAYLHSGTDNKANRDGNFQGFGRFTTGSTGEYYFRTIKPVPYPGRTPHIHVKIKRGGKELLTTQCYIAGHEQNEKDGIYKAVRDPKERESITVPFRPLEGSKFGELAAQFNIVLGLTPEA
ncbi:MAG: protocatechuate 3,4-dioxygenase [Isosphaeraceae bacterium]